MSLYYEIIQLAVKTQLDADRRDVVREQRKREERQGAHERQQKIMSLIAARHALAQRVVVRGDLLHTFTRNPISPAQTTFTDNCASDLVDLLKYESRLPDERLARDHLCVHISRK
ncbi:hypothetical protein PF006_g7260 [Phytophthora fragariae]|uniref:Uncharacterized protein n=1 Tax=Phytophthora fragariae TaxID=53985 RepID=A0A6A3UCK6_9STRA|nr:hypothetical protein PF006_g7260 [Phytophthora fragariae]